jgi:hypothetical protein
MASKIASATVAIAVMAAISQSVWAQTAATTDSAAAPPVSREQRKADTAAANKAGQLTPAGQGPQAPTPTGKSTMTREQRKAQARADEKAGKMTPAGEGPGNR